MPAAGILLLAGTPGTQTCPHSMSTPGHSDVNTSKPQLDVSLLNLSLPHSFCLTPTLQKPSGFSLRPYVQSTGRLLTQRSKCIQNRICLGWPSLLP